MTGVAECLRYEIEQRFRVHPEVGSSYMSPTDEPYVTIGVPLKTGWPITGVLTEGEERMVYDGEKAAYIAARAAFEVYANYRSGVLYWRQPPLLEWFGDRCVIYMRCLISDRRVSVQDAGYIKIPVTGGP